MIEFWFDFASPYSYLAAMRIEQAAQLTDVSGGIRPVEAHIGQGVARAALGHSLQQGFEFVMGHNHHAIHQMGFVHLLSFQI